MSASTTGSSGATEEVRRLTPTERLHELQGYLHEVTMASLARRPSEPESSVTVSRNAKGAHQFEVTVRGPDATNCRDVANLIVRDLTAMYPYPDANGGEG